MNISSNAAISGINASIVRQDASAHDVANINTDGYRQTIPYQTDTSPTGTRIAQLGHEANTAGAPSTTDLATEVVEQKENVATLKANSAVMKIQDKMIGSLLDIFG